MNRDDEAENPIEGFQVIEVRICRFATQSISAHKPVRALGNRSQMGMVTLQGSANGRLFRPNKVCSQHRRSSAREVDQDPAGARNCTSLNEDVPWNDVPMYNTRITVRFSMPWRLFWL